MKRKLFLLLGLAMPVGSEVGAQGATLQSLRSVYPMNAYMLSPRDSQLDRSPGISCSRAAAPDSAFISSEAQGPAPMNIDTWRRSFTVPPRLEWAFNAIQLAPGDTVRARIDRLLACGGKNILLLETADMYFSMTLRGRSDPRLLVKGPSGLEVAVVLGAGDDVRLMSGTALRDSLAKLEATRKARIRRRGWPAKVTVAVIGRQLLVGMTAEQVTEAWGVPSQVNETTTAEGTREQWVYPDQRYAYLARGRVVAIELTKRP